MVRLARAAVAEHVDRCSHVAEGSRSRGRLIQQKLQRLQLDGAAPASPLTDEDISLLLVLVEAHIYGDDAAVLSAYRDREREQYEPQRSGRGAPAVMDRCYAWMAAHYAWRRKHFDRERAKVRWGKIATAWGVSETIVKRAVRDHSPMHDWFPKSSAADKVPPEVTAVVRRLRSYAPSAGTKSKAAKR